MGDIRPKVLSNDHMPGCAVSSVKLLLDLSSNVLLDVVFLEGGGGDVDGLLLHLLAHVDIFDDGFGCLADETSVFVWGAICCRVHFGRHCDGSQSLRKRWDGCGRGRFKLARGARRVAVAGFVRRLSSVHLPPLSLTRSIHLSMCCTIAYLISQHVTLCRLNSPAYSNLHPCQNSSRIAVHAHRLQRTVHPQGALRKSCRHPCAAHAVALRVPCLFSLQPSMIWKYFSPCPICTVH